MLNRRELAIFVALYLYMVNMSTANDMRRVIILASLIQIHALRAQLLILNQRRIQRRRRAGRLRRRFWVLPRPVQSWFDIHFVDIAIPDDYFRRQLRLNRTTFTMLLNTLRPRLTRQNTSFRDCIAPECTFDGRVCHKINRKAKMSTKSPAPRQDSGAFEEWPRKDKDGRVRPSRSHLACSAMTGF